MIKKVQFEESVEYILEEYNEIEIDNTEIFEGYNTEIYERNCFWCKLKQFIKIIWLKIIN